MTYRTMLRAALGVLVLGGATAGCGDDSASTTLQGLVRPTPLEVGAVTLPEVTVDDAGTPFRFVAAPGTLLVAYFGYTNCPDLCPTTLADLRTARKRIGAAADVVDLALVTVDPDRDTAAVLRAYVGSFATRFHVLRTTDPAALTAAESVFLASSSVTKAPDGKIEVSHSATAYVIDDTGRVLVEWPFGIGPSGMTNDLKILIEQLKETAS